MGERECGVPMGVVGDRAEEAGLAVATALARLLAACEAGGLWGLMEASDRATAELLDAREAGMAAALAVATARFLARGRARDDRVAGGNRHLIPADPARAAEERRVRDELLRRGVRLVGTCDISGVQLLERVDDDPDPHGDFEGWDA